MTDPEQTGARTTGPLDAAGNGAPTSHTRTPRPYPSPSSSPTSSSPTSSSPTPSNPTSSSPTPSNPTPSNPSVAIPSAAEPSPDTPGFPGAADPPAGSPVPGTPVPAGLVPGGPAPGPAAAGASSAVAQGGRPSAPARPPVSSVADGHARLEEALREVKRVIVGQDHMVERMIVALLARGHCLLEGVPGVAKTLAVQTLATVVGGTFKRIQFTRDMVVSDIVGGRILVQLGEFLTELGPVFANFVLADEINRGPTKVQSALLEVMAERQISLGGTTHRLPLPFVVMATQNPIESEGVYPLPEAQRDRFLMRVIVPYPTASEERRIVRRMGVRPPVARQVLDTDSLRLLQEAADDIFVHDHISDYAVRLVLATRDPAGHGLPELVDQLEYGASPRGTLALISSARALALLRGRDYVVPDDVASVAGDVLPHRLVMSYKALADGLTADMIIQRVLEVTLPPRISPMRSQNVMVRPPVQEPAGAVGDAEDPDGRWHADETGFPEYEDGYDS